MKSKELNENKLMGVYKRVNPSEYNFEINRQSMTNLFLNRIKLPPGMFENARVLDLGAGTGERDIVFAAWGARITCVEINEIAIDKLKDNFRRHQLDSQLEAAHNISLADWEPEDQNQSFDITLSLGVFNHLHDLRKAFTKQTRYLRKGGFTALGLGESAGDLQRAIQRCVLYTLSKGSEEEIIRLAKLLFRDHLERAVKFGGRTEEAVIYDSYVNTQHTELPAFEIMKWFEEEGIRYYSSWPPIEPWGMADPYQREALTSSAEKAIAFAVSSQLAWMVHSIDDAELFTDEELGVEFGNKLYDAVKPFNHVDKEMGLDSIHDCTRSMQKLVPEAKDVFSRSIFAELFEKFTSELNEVSQVLNTGDENKVKEKIDSCRLLFKGSAGVGMHYFAGYKK